MYTVYMIYNLHIYIFIYTYMQFIYVYIYIYIAGAPGRTVNLRTDESAN